MMIASKKQNGDAKMQIQIIVIFLSHLEPTLFESMFVFAYFFLVEKNKEFFFQHSYEKERKKLNACTVHVYAIIHTERKEK